MDQARAPRFIEHVKLPLVFLAAAGAITLSATACGEDPWGQNITVGPYEYGDGTASKHVYERLDNTDTPQAGDTKRGDKLSTVTYWCEKTNTGYELITKETFEDKNKTPETDRGFSKFCSDGKITRPEAP